MMEKKMSDREFCIEVDEGENIRCKICKSDVLKVRYGTYEVIAECPNCKWVTDIYN